MKSQQTKTSDPAPFLADRLAQAAWHEALTRITSGLVHDTNNCLAGIVSLSEHCIEVARKQPKSFTDELALINQAGHKAGEILKNFIHLNPIKAPEPTYYDLNALATESVDALQRALKRKLTFQLHLGPGPMPVLLDGWELKKAIICLAFNLADSIAESGQILIQTSVPAGPVAARIYQGASPKGPTVALNLSTTSPQVPALQWEDLFEPNLTGDATTDLFRLRFCLIKQTLEKANGALSFQSSQPPEFSLFLPKASLD
jgi:hypothetical protein